MVLVERIAIHHRGKGPGVRAVPYICFSQIQPQQPIRFFSSIAASSTTTSLGPLLFRCCSTSKWLVPGRWAPHRERRTGPSSLSFSSLGGCHHRFTSTLVAAAAAVQPTTTTTARGSTTTTSTTDTTTPTSDDAPTSPLSSSLSPPEDPSSSLPWIQQVESLLAAAGGNYHHHNVMRAQRIYNDNYYHPNDPRSTNQQQQPTPTRTTTTERSENLLRPIQSQLFDAWMVHQNDAVAAVLRNNISSSQEEEEEENGKGGDGAVVVAAACHHKGPRVPVSSLSSLSFRNTTGMEQQQQLDGGASALQSIGAAAHNAHTLLEHMEAFFGTRYERMLQQQQQQKSLDDFNNTNDTAAVVSGPNNARRTSTGHVNPSRVTEDSDAMQRRCEAVLTAWAQTSSIMVHGIGHGRIVGGGDTVESAAAAAHGRRSWTRGVPQRAQFLLERMEAAGGTKTGMGGQVAAATAVPDVYATLTGYNRVLMTWAYSSEHLRGASAERLFAKLLACKSIASPNTESYRLMVWAWALSRDPRCAFSATGHLMKMLRRLEAGWEKENPDVVRDGSNMEPTIDDYHVVFQAWARSE